MATTIKISRSASIEESRDVALIRLDKHIEHHPGQPVEVLYRTETNTIDSIVAIGVKDGYGRDCYSILASRGEVVVNDVLYELEDVSELINGGRYIVLDNNVWKLELLGDDGVIRNIIPLEDISDVMIYKNLRDGYNWYWRDNILKREDSFYTDEQLTEKVQNMIDESSYVDFSVMYYGETNLYAPDTIVTSPKFIVKLSVGSHDYLDRATIKVSSSEHEEEEIKSIEGNILTLYGSFDKDVTFTFTVNYYGVTYTATSEIRFMKMARYGSIHDGEDVPEYNDLSLKVVYFDPKVGIDLSYDLQDAKSLLIVPGDISFKRILDENSLDYIYDYTSYSMNGYTIYLKKTSTTINNFKQVFII